jgi:hypothetical protein
VKTKRDAFEKLDGTIFNSLKINEMSKIKGGKGMSAHCVTGPCSRTGTDYTDRSDSDDAQPV